mgnify:CR=1 FL=1
MHVHDLVDFVSEEAEIAGKFAALEAQGKLDNDTKFVTVTAEKRRAYMRSPVPQSAQSRRTGTLVYACSKPRAQG